MSHDDFLPGIISVLVTAAIFTWLITRSIDFTDDCESAGGRIANVYGGRLCLSPDGRVLSTIDEGWMLNDD